MKNFIACLFLIASCLNAYPWTAYINKNGVFTKVPIKEWKSVNLPKMGKFKPGSIGYLPTKLGFLPDEWYDYMNNDNDVIIFKSFTQEPICVLDFSESNSDILRPEEYAKKIKDFDYKKEFLSLYDPSDKKMRASFLEKVLKTSVSGDSLVDNINGFTFYFKNGVTYKAKSNDGLNKWARYFKQSQVFKYIEQNAYRKHNSREDAIKEINFQCICFSKMKPEHFELAFNSTYNYNLALVWFALYGVEAKATLSDFLFCVPDAETISANRNTIKLSWGYDIFVFQNDILVDVR